MSVTYHPILVTLSLLIGVLASYVALDFTGHVSDARGRERAAWLAGGAFALGVGVWSVHFVGMLAFRLRVGVDVVPIGYHMPRMLVAIAVATAGAALTFLITSRRPAGAVSVPLGGVCLGSAIAATHYTAVTAMRVMAHRTHRHDLVGVSIVIAIVASYVALRVAAPRGEADARLSPGRRFAGAAAMTIAIAGTHYTGMASARFTASRSAMRIRDSDVIATDGLSAILFVAALVILGLALLIGTLDRRARERLRAADEYARLFREADSARAEAEAARQRAEESERRFRRTADTAPVLIWMAGTDSFYEYVNATWLAFTGRTAEQELSEAWTESVHPDDIQRRLSVYLGAFQARESFRLEYRLRRSDGRYRWLLESGAPRFTPQGEFAGYIGTAVDVTQLKESERMHRLLLEAARQLGTSLDLDVTLRQVVTIVVPGFADFCIVRLVDDKGVLRQAAFAHVDGAKEPLLEELGRVYTPDKEDPRSVVARVFESAEAALWSTPSMDETRSISQDPAVQRIVGELGIASSMVVPLVVHGEVMGTLTLSSSVSGRVYDRRDLEHAEILATRIALAISNARLYTELREAAESAVRASRLETQLVQVRLAALRAQLNPHFLFNALNTIAMLVRRGAAADAMTGLINLSDLLRYVLEGVHANEVEVAEEIGFVERYLQLEQLRFRDRMQVEIDVDAAALRARVPTLVLQPLVENAVRHGIARRAEDGRVRVRGWVEDGMLVLDVCDNGPGFPPDWRPGPATGWGGVGLSATRERLRHLYGDAHEFEVGNDPDGGALVTIRIPYVEFSPAVREPR
jgi:PAS domain S-box-containing protein